MKTVCCVCRRIKGREGWVDAVDCPASVRVSHGYCPRCFEEVRKMLRAAASRGAGYHPLPDHS